MEKTKKRSWNRLQFKIMASLILFIIFPLISVNLILQLYFKKLIWKNTEFAFQNAVLNVDNSLKNLMKEMGVTLNLLSTDSTIYHALDSSPRTSSEDIHAKIDIDNATAQYQKYVFYCVVDFLIINNEGTPYSTYHVKQPKLLQTDETMNLFLQVKKNNLNYTYFTTTMDTLGKGTSEPVICIGKSIRNYKKELLGTCILIVNEYKFFQILEKSTLYTDSINLLSDQNGNIVSSKDKSLLGISIDDYLQQKDHYYVLSHKLSNKWNYTSLIRKSDLYKDSSFTSQIITLDILMTLCFIFAIFFILHSFLKPIKSLKTHILSVENGDFTTRFHSNSNDELADLGNCFNHMSERLDILFQRTKEQQKKLLQRENEKEKFRYMVLQSQINPHLMFNTLNNIKWMALINKDQPVANAIASFGRLLEKTLKSGGDHFTIREELEYIQEYMEVMKPHSPNPITLTIQVESDHIYDHLILKLLLQPIVENAILHGLRDPHDSPCITIIIQEKNDFLICIVKDNGEGMTIYEQENIYLSKSDKQKLSHSIGLSNTRERIRLFYGKKGKLSIASRGGKGTIVTFELPLVKEV